LEVRRGRMTKTSISLQELRRKIYKKAKTEKHWRFWNKPLKEIIQSVNLVIRGWVNYFRIGNSNRTFNKVRNDIEKKVRKFVMRRKKLKGFGWKLWSREDIYKKWGLYNDYRIRYIYPKATPSR
jgi:RNA-directed DNA polymerase